MGFEEAFQAADQAVRSIRSEGLRDIERVVLEGSWHRQTYQKIASEAGYTEGYLSRDVGPALWSVLSDALGTQVKKTNFRTAIEHWAQQYANAAATPRDIVSSSTPLPEVSEPVVPPVSPSPSASTLDISDFRGRTETLTLLSDWVIRDRGRLLLISGVPGVGKTWLALKLAQSVVPDFVHQIYQPLRDCKNPQEVLALLLNRVKISSHPQASLTDCIELLVQALTQTRTLVVLDETEHTWESGSLAGTWASEWEALGEILQALAMRSHQSCVVWVGRVLPRAALPLFCSNCRWQALSGLPPEELSQLPFWPSNIQASPEDWAWLHDRYGGIPALIKTVVVPRLLAFNGQPTPCLKALRPDDKALQAYLDNWLSPLSELEQEILTWLLIRHRPVFLSELAEVLGESTPLAVVESLHERGLLCRTMHQSEESAWELALPELLGPHLCDRFLRGFYAASRNEQLQWLDCYPLLEAQAPETVRDWQRTHLLQPIAASLAQICPTLQSKQAFLRETLSAPLSHPPAHSVEKTLPTLPLQDIPFGEPGRRTASGYRTGNLINVAQVWQVPLVGLSLRNLPLREADLQSDYCQGISLAGADLSQAALAKPIGRSPVIAVSPHQDFLAVGDQEGRLLLWCYQDGRLQRASLDCPEAIRAVAFSADGNLLAEGRQDGTVYLWDLRTEYEPERFAHTAGAAVTALVFSQDAQWLIGGDAEGHIALWRVASGEQVHHLLAHEAAVVQVAVSPRGDRFASCAQDRLAKEWWLETGALLHEFRGGVTCQLGGVAYLPTSTAESLAVVMGYDEGQDEGQIVVWEIPTSRATRILNGCEPFIHLAMSAEGRYLAVSDASNTVSLWDLAARERLHCLTPARVPVGFVAFSPDSTHLVTGCDYLVQLWQVDMGSCLRSWRSDRHPAQKLAITQSPLQLLSSHDDGSLRLWQAVPDHTRWLPQTRSHLPAEGRTSTLEISTTGQYWAVGMDTGHIYVWQASAQDWSSMAFRLPGVITALAFNRQEDLLAAGDDQGNVALWNVRDRIFRWQKHHPHSDRVLTLVFSLDGQRIYSGSGDRTIQGWDFQGTALETLTGHRRRVHTLCLSADGNILYSGSQDGTVRRWHLDTQEQQEIWQIGDHYNRSLHRLALGTCPDPLALVSDAHLLEIWHLTESPHRIAAISHDTPLWHVSVSADGEAWVTATQTGEITLGRLPTGEIIGRFRVDRPYEGMVLGDCTGLSDSERAMLHALGATDF